MPSVRVLAASRRPGRSRRPCCRRGSRSGSRSDRRAGVRGSATGRFGATLLGHIAKVVPPHVTTQPGDYSRRPVRPQRADLLAIAPVERVPRGPSPGPPMRFGLAGFPGSGKTTLFNAMTGLNVPVGYGGEVRGLPLSRHLAEEDHLRDHGARARPEGRLPLSRHLAEEDHLRDHQPARRENTVRARRSCPPKACMRSGTARRSA